MDAEFEVKSGYLITNNKSFLGGSSQNKKWCVLVTKASTCSAGLYQHESHQNISKHPKNIDLDKILKVDKIKGKDLSFEVVVKKEKHIFSTETNDDKLSWMHAFKSLIPSEKMSNCRNSTSSSVSEELVVNENVLYESLDAPPMFPVKVMENEYSIKNQLSTSKKYALAVHVYNIALLELPSKNVVFQWPFQFIRSFGRTPEMFQINAGRRCPSGEGTFIFVTYEANIIFTAINNNTRTTRSNESGGATAKESEIIHPPNLPPAKSSPKLSHSEKPKILHEKPKIVPEKPKIVPEKPKTVPEKPKIVLEKPKVAHNKTNISLSEKANIVPPVKPLSITPLSSDQSAAFKQNLGEKLVLKKSLSDEGKPVRKSEKELKKEKERERKECEKREKEKQRERERKEKEDAKKREKEKKELKKQPKNVKPVSNDEKRFYENPSSTYEEVDPISPPVSIKSGYIENQVKQIECNYSEPLLSEPPSKAETYSDAEVKRIEAWREFGQDKDNDHVENYENFKTNITSDITEGDYDLIEGFEDMAKSQAPDLEDIDETYDHFPQKISTVKQDTENIYGISSGKAISSVPDVKTVSAGSEYEEASTVIVKDLSQFKKCIVLRTDNFPGESSDYEENKL